MIMGQQTHYMQIVPNSHSFGSLENILILNKIYKEYLEKKEMKRNKNKHIYVSTPHELTKEYLLIGFQNTFKREYEIQQMGEPLNTGPIFASIENIINYIEQPDFDLKLFIDIIQNTLNNNIDLKCKRKMERTDVYKCIDTERQYQDLRWSPRREKNGTPDESKPPAEWINYIEFHVAKAKEEVYLLNEEEALAHIRKVAALAVRWLEIHGCPERIIPKELLGDK